MKSKAWQAAVDKEILALKMNHTWDIVPLHFGKCPIRVSGSLGLNIILMVQWKGTRLGWWQKAILNRKALIILNPSFLFLSQYLSGFC